MKGPIVIVAPLAVRGLPALWWDGRMNSSAVMRPSRVTTACLFIGMSCAIILFYVGSWLGGWGSIEVQKQVRQTFHVTDIPAWLQEALLAGATVSAVGIVFAIYTLKGHEPSRIILTVFAGLTAIVFLFEGPFGFLPAAFSVACGIYLWSADANTWFGIKNGRIAAPEPAPTPDPFSKPVPPPALDADTQAPVPYGVSPTAARRPGAVQIAGIIAIVASSLVFFFGGLFLVVYATAYDQLIKAETDSPAMKWFGASDTDITGGLHSSAVLFGFLVPLSLLAIAAAIALLNRKKLGWVATLTLAYVSVPVGIFMIVGLPWAIAAIVSIVLLHRPESKAWFESRQSF